ncbi:unnamed protein product [Adineta ricciae]|uniref:Uncharacterized protein n=1 Tax=Adineta ricciae TaxID=249248 RepID=A0A816H7K1_ADIRI|nr:unnamed protein product [Adineta ricciae]
MFLRLNCYIVFHHPPYAIGPVLACYTTTPTAQMTPSYLHPAMSDIPKRLQLEPTINEIEDKSNRTIHSPSRYAHLSLLDRRQIIICNNEAMWSEQ